MFLHYYINTVNFTVQSYLYYRLSYLTADTYVGYHNLIIVLKIGFIYPMKSS